MGYKIGSFNLYKCSLNTSSSQKNFRIIADIISRERFDVVALQEIFDEDSARQICQRLGSRWRFSWDTPEKSLSRQAAEGYAYIWNSDRLDLVKTIVDGQIRIAYPLIYNQYRIDKSAHQTRLIRNPYYGRFTPVDKPGGLSVELRLINVHLRFGGDEEKSLSAGKMREKELEILTKALFPTIEDKVYKYHLTPYTIILGDYNLNLRHVDTTNGIINPGPYTEEYIIVNPNQISARLVNSYIIQKNLHTVQKGLTTLKRSSTEQENGYNDGYKSNYDHFTYNESHFKLKHVHRIDAVKRYYGSDYEKYRDQVSDHIPISAVIDFKGRT